MHQAAHIVSFNDLLSLLSKDNLERLMNNRRLLKVLKTANRALQYYQAQFEDVQGPFRFEVGGLRYGALHEIFLRHVHFEDAESQHRLLSDFLRGFEMIDRVGVDV